MYGGESCLPTDLRHLQLIRPKNSHMVLKLTVCETADYFLPPVSYHVTLIEITTMMVLQSPPDRTRPVY